MNKHDTLWKNSLKKDDEILENQKTFMTEYGVIKRITSKPYWYLNNNYEQQNLDHMRVFLMNNGTVCHVVIRSEYCDEDYSNQGWKKIYPVYNKQANSWIKFFPFTKERFLKEYALSYKGLNLDKYENNYE